MHLLDSSSSATDDVRNNDDGGMRLNVFRAIWSSSDASSVLSPASPPGLLPGGKATSLGGSSVGALAESVGNGGVNGDLGANIVSGLNTALLKPNSSPNPEVIMASFVQSVINVEEDEDNNYDLTSAVGTSMGSSGEDSSVTSMGISLWGGNNASTNDAVDDGLGTGLGIDRHSRLSNRGMLGLDSRQSSAAPNVSLINGGPNTGSSASGDHVSALDSSSLYRQQQLSQQQSVLLQQLQRQSLLLQQTITDLERRLNTERMMRLSAERTAQQATARAEAAESEVELLRASIDQSAQPQWGQQQSSSTGGTTFNHFSLLTQQGQQHQQLKQQQPPPSFLSPSYFGGGQF